MDDQAMIKTYGTPTLPEATPERPLVTFALFAYNQEKYIREAVEGAFSQTYSPLEIILSDDCSSDQTFEIMEEMAREYRGPHLVRVVKNVQNMGLVPHVLHVAKQSAGEIVVVAAGDDISRPNRVSAHVPIYADPTVYGVTGAFDLVDDRTVEISTDNIIPIGLGKGRSADSAFKWTKHNYETIQGSTASYRRIVFELPFPPWKIKFSEDNLLNFIIYSINKRVAKLNKSLVLYRVHEKALSNRGVKNHSISSFERESHSASMRQVNKMETFLWISEKVDAQHVDRDFIIRRLKEARVVEAWPSQNFLRRLISILRDVSIFELSMLKWKAARIFGEFPNYQPKIAVSQIKIPRK